MLYGTGMRVNECMRMRVQDVQFDQHRIVVRGAKNDKDRYVPLPKSDEQPLREWLVRRRALYEADKAKNMHEVEVPYALVRKYPNAPFDWAGSMSFPRRLLDRPTKRPCQKESFRRPADPGAVQAAVREAG
jgi:integrase